MKIVFNDKIELSCFRFNKTIASEDTFRELISIRFQYNEETENILNHFLTDNIILSFFIENDYKEILFQSKKEYFVYRVDREIGSNNNQIILILKEVLHFENE